MSKRLIDFDRGVQKFLESLPPKQTAQLARRIFSLMDIYPPIPHDVRKIGDDYAIDEGEYRIVYGYKKFIITVYVVDRRNDCAVYKKVARRRW